MRPILASTPSGTDFDSEETSRLKVTLLRLRLSRVLPGVLCHKKTKPSSNDENAGPMPAIGQQHKAPAAATVSVPRASYTRPGTQLSVAAGSQPETAPATKQDEKAGLAATNLKGEAQTGEATGEAASETALLAEAMAAEEAKEAAAAAAAAAAAETEARGFVWRTPPDMSALKAAAAEAAEVAVEKQAEAETMADKAKKAEEAAAAQAAAEPEKRAAAQDKAAAVTAEVEAVAAARVAEAAAAKVAKALASQLAVAEDDRGAVVTHPQLVEERAAPSEDSV